MLDTMKARPRMQQQPRRVMDRQQQQSSGSGEFQPRAFSSSQADGQARLNQAGEQFYERGERSRSQSGTEQA
ncbi:MAG: hypothetical protein V4614_16085 [Pseudomonadota bacterium]